MNLNRKLKEVFEMTNFRLLRYYLSFTMSQVSTFMTFPRVMH
jgi:hypothetical protein